jgi:hypothetical protein
MKKQITSVTDARGMKVFRGHFIIALAYAARTGTKTWKVAYAISGCGYKTQELPLEHTTIGVYTFSKITLSPKWYR